MNKPVIEALNLAKIYQEEPEKPILQRLNFSLNKGESIAIVGASGSGKSTLLHLLGGLDQPSAGSVYWQGQDISTWSEKELSLQRNNHLGFVYQFHHLLPEFSALDNVAMPLRLKGQPKKQAHELALHWLNQFKLSDRAHALPGQLSGGQRQRVAIARALVTTPQAILADEPTGNLDTQTAHLVFEEMQKINQNLSVALVLVTHANSLAMQCAKLLRLDDGKLYQP
jgi:lipoprotein-releasing system ATP-binding protein